MNRFLPGALLRHLLLFTLSAMPLTSRAIEKPDYEVNREFDYLALRQCAHHVTEVVLNASTIQAGSQAFRIRAVYIFGENKGEKKFEMTAPVTQAAVPGARRAQWVLPKGVTQENCCEAN